MFTKKINSKRGNTYAVRNIVITPTLYVLNLSNSL